MPTSSKMFSKLTKSLSITYHHIDVNMDFSVVGVYVVLDPCVVIFVIAFCLSPLTYSHRPDEAMLFVMLNVCLCYIFFYFQEL